MTSTQTLLTELADNKKSENPASRTLLKVLMIGALPTDLTQVKGGVEAVIINLFAGFRNQHDVKVDHVAFTKEVSEHQTIRIADNITVHFVPFRIKYELPDYFLNKDILNKIIQENKPDLIHIQEITPQIIRFINFPKSNIIVTQHGIMKEELKYAVGISQKLKCTFKAYVERYIFPIFRNVIFISRYNEKLYPSKEITSAQIYNPVNPIFFDSPDAENVSDNTMIYVGVLSRRKNIGIVIEALHELKKLGKIYKLHVVGGFKDDGYEKEIMNMIDIYDLSSQIKFHGWRTQEEIRTIYKDCPIFILPSLQETLPVSIGEAMAMGKIVIASDVGAINEMFTDKKSGFLFRRNDKDDLVKVLGSIYETQERHELSGRAKKEASDKFHPDHIAKKTIDFYREVLTAQSAKAV